MFNDQITDALLRGVKASRVKQRPGSNGKQFSYLEGYEVRANLNRIFGFGSWNVEVTDLTEVYSGAEKKEDGRRLWHVSYRATVRLSIRNDSLSFFTTYEDVACDEAINPNRAEATDQAIKSAVTSALKRAAANLGDQFGLSLYREGSTRPIVNFVLGHNWHPEPVDASPSDGPVAQDVQESADDEQVPDEELAEASEVLQEQLGAEPVNSGAWDAQTS